MKVKPAIKGAIIRDPHSRIPLPAEGAEVPETPFWTRRLIAGEVVRIIDPPARATRRASGSTPGAEDAERSTPTGLEPVAPLTTRDPDHDDEWRRNEPEKTS